MTEKAKRILFELDRMFPHAKAELIHHNAYELLIAVVLSAQTTDVSVNRITPELFNVYPDANALASADIIDLENKLKSIGLYRNKAKHIKALAETLVLKHGGEVPNERIHLEALPGVGRKTANVVLSNAFHRPQIAVDTHVSRVSKRLNLAKEEDSVFEIEQKLMRKFPKDYWTKLHHQLIFFGRYHCLARRPKCANCPLFDLCRYTEKRKYEKIE